MGKDGSYCYCGHSCFAIRMFCKNRTRMSYHITSLYVMSLQGLQMARRCILKLRSPALGDCAEHAVAVRFGRDHTSTNCILSANAKPKLHLNLNQILPSAVCRSESRRPGKGDASGWQNCPIDPYGSLDISFPCVFTEAMAAAAATVLKAAWRQIRQPTHHTPVYPSACIDTEIHT